MFNLFKNHDNEIVAMADGDLIDVTMVNDEMFATQMLGKTIAFDFSESKYICSPANGVLEVLFPTGHAFAVRMKDGTGLLIHIGIDTVELQGSAFKVLAKQGQEVKAGEKIVEVDWDVIDNAKLEKAVMLVVTEKGEEVNTDFKISGKVKKGEVINN